MNEDYTGNIYECFVATLAMIDDVAGISECGNNSVTLNEWLIQRLKLKWENSTWKRVTTCTSEHKGTIAEGRYTQISEGYYEHE